VIVVVGLIDGITWILETKKLLDCWPGAMLSSVDWIAFWQNFIACIVMVADPFLWVYSLVLVIKYEEEPLTYRYLSHFALDAPLWSRKPFLRWLKFFKVSWSILDLAHR